MTKYNVRLEDGYRFVMQANLIEASASISANFFDDDDEEALVHYLEIQDAVNNTYVEGISDLEWLEATLKRLGVNPTT